MQSILSTLLLIAAAAARPGIGGLMCANRERPACSSGSPPSCSDGGHPPCEDRQRPTCDDGAAPLCADGTKPKLPHPHHDNKGTGPQHQHEDGDQQRHPHMPPMCANGARPACSSGSPPSCSDGGHPPCEDRHRPTCDDGAAPLCADGTELELPHSHHEDGSTELPRHQHENGDQQRQHGGSGPDHHYKHGEDGDSNSDDRRRPRHPPILPLAVCLLVGMCVGCTIMWARNRCAKRSQAAAVDLKEAPLTGRCHYLMCSSAKENKKITPSIGGNAPITIEVDASIC